MAERTDAEWEAHQEALDAAVLAWLETRPPEDLHRSAMTANWDGDGDRLEWIATRPDCDRATAACLFALAQPGFYRTEAEIAEAADAFDDGARILRVVLTRWREGLYARRGVGLSAEQRGRLDEARLALAEAEWEIPADIFGPHEGTPIPMEEALDAGWIEGIPPHLVEAFDVPR